MHVEAGEQCWTPCGYFNSAKSHHSNSYGSGGEVGPGSGEEAHTGVKICSKMPITESKATGQRTYYHDTLQRQS